MSPLPTRLDTPDDLLTLPDSERSELVEGQLVKLELSLGSSWIAGELHRRLGDYCAETGRGWSFPESTSYIGFGWDGRRVRRPDASVILEKWLPGGPLQDGHCTDIPDVVVEVVSPHDLDQEIEDKVAEYLMAGVRLIWVVNPSTHSILVHRPGAQSLRLGNGINSRARTFYRGSAPWWPRSSRRNSRIRRPQRLEHD